MMRLLCALLLVLSSTPLVCQTISGKVVSVHDGDTLTLLVGKETFQIRLAEIDAPEISQAFGTVSKQYLSDQVYRREVDVQTQGVDQYGRTIGTVFAGGQSINRMMVWAGLAWHYKAFSKDQGLADLEAQAHAAGRGLWVDKAPVPPWLFRKTKK